jgi:hypothetical protein
MFSEPPIMDSGGANHPKEGTVDNPITVQGCTAVAFANFLGWLNHKYVFHILPGSNISI